MGIAKKCSRFRKLFNPTVRTVEAEDPMKEPAHGEMKPGSGQVRENLGQGVERKKSSSRKPWAH